MSKVALMNDVLEIDPTSEGIARDMAFETVNPFKHPMFGAFVSFEGFWYYVRSHGTATNARFVSDGWGRRRFRNPGIPVDNFDEIIYDGYYHMLMCMPKDKLQAILDNDRKFTFVYKDPATSEMKPTSYAWVAKGLANVIDHIRRGVPYPTPNYGKLLATAVIE